MSNNYSVGYGKPPKNTQFKKGKSGNPRGRPPKAISGLGTKLLSELAELVQTKDGQEITKLEAMLKNLVNSAAKGDLKSQIFVFKEVLKVEGANRAQMFLDRLVDDGIIEPDDARDYANKCGALKLNIRVLRNDHINRIRAIDAVDMLEAIAYFYAMEEASLWTERIRSAVFAEFEFWSDVEAGWEMLNLTQEQLEMLQQQMRQRRAYDRPTIEMLQNAVELCGAVRHQCDMWYMAYRDIYANMPLIDQTAREARHSKSENSDGLDKHTAKKLRALLSKRRQAYDDFMTCQFPFAEWQPKHELTVDAIGELVQWYLSGHE